MKPVVLVTAIGTAASTAIILQLRKADSYYIIGGDIFERNQVASAKDVDEFYSFPSATEDLNLYMDFAVAFCKEHSINYYFAVIDEEVVNLSKNRERFEEVGVLLCIPNHKLVMTCHYKNIFSDWIEKNILEVSIKRYRKFSEIDVQGFPLFIKPIEGRASLGCRKIMSRRSLDEVLNEDINETDFIIQEYINGEIITVDLVRNAKTGQAMQIQRLEKLRNSNGCGIAVEIIQNPILTRICNQIMEKLDLNGVANAEFFRIGDQYKIIEINPRFSAGTSFSCISGCDIVIAALKIADGKDFHLGTPNIGMHLAKRYETYCLIE